MKNINFKTKEEYLQYRKDWKEEYNALSQKIRDVKWLRLTYSRAFSKAETEMKSKSPIKSYYEEFSEIMDNSLNHNERYHKLIEKHYKDKKYYSFSWEREIFRGRANEMIEELKQAKSKSHEQYLARLKQTENQMVV